MGPWGAGHLALEGPAFNWLSSSSSQRLITSRSFSILKPCRTSLHRIDRPPGPNGRRTDHLLPAPDRSCACYRRAHAILPRAKGRVIRSPPSENPTSDGIIRGGRMRSSAGEHLVHTEGVTGSIPVASTTGWPWLRRRRRGRRRPSALQPPRSAYRAATMAAAGSFGRSSSPECPPPRRRGLRRRRVVLQRRRAGRQHLDGEAPQLGDAAAVRHGQGDQGPRADQGAPDRVRPGGKGDAGMVGVFRDSSRSPARRRTPRTSRCARSTSGRRGDRGRPSPGRSPHRPSWRRRRPPPRLRSARRGTGRGPPCSSHVRAAS